MKQVYLAARYSRRLELCRYREVLRAHGLLVQARWLDVGTPIGESGEALVESGSDKAALLRSKFADDDYQDVRTADIVISFTEAPRESSANRGGRHVEFGIALAHGSALAVIGYRENIFHWLPQVSFYPTWDDFLRHDSLTRAGVYDR